MATLNMRQLAEALSNNERHGLGAVRKNEARQAAIALDVVDRGSNRDLVDERDLERIAVQVARQRRDRGLGGGGAVGAPALPHRPPSHPLTPHQRENVELVEGRLRQLSTAQPQEPNPDD